MTPLQRGRSYIAALDEPEVTRRFYTKRRAYRWASEIHAETGTAYVVSRIHRDGTLEILAAMPKLLTTERARQAWLRMLYDQRRY